jgi:hypothetical protein
MSKKEQLAPEEYTRSINIRIAPIKVMLNTNIPGSEKRPLEFSMLYHPDLEKGRYSAKTYTLPFFTDTCKYPMDVLAKKEYSDRVDFFFNRTRFNKILRKTLVDYIDYDAEKDESNPELTAQISKQESDNADHNIKSMLILLLPISDDFTKVFQTSYDQYILNKPSPEIFTTRNIDPFKFLNPTWFPIYNYFQPRQYYAPIQEVSYLVYGGQKYIVESVIWQNDLVNHPVYREFLSTYNTKVREKNDSRRKLAPELKLREEAFVLLLDKYKEYDDVPTKGDDDKPDKKRTVFAYMIETLIKNVSIISENEKERRPNTEYLLTSAAGVGFNPTDAGKRDIITKMVNYLGAIDDIYNGYAGKLTGTTKHGNPIKTFKDEPKLVQKVVDNIVNAYIEYTTYNSTPNANISLKDAARILTELYNTAIILKTMNILNEFVHDRIRRLDLSEQNEDGSSKTKLELDILRIMNTNFKYYVDLNTAIKESLKSVVEPKRKSSNVQLQNFLRQLVKPVGTQSTDDTRALIDIYNRYITNIKKHIPHNYITKYMNTGVCTVVDGDQSKAQDSSVSEYPEVHVYVNVVEKNEYEQNKGRDCAMADDTATNSLKQILYANTMLDSSFPELNPYRGFKLLKGSEDKTLLEQPGPAPPATAPPAPASLSPPPKTGGKHRRHTRRHPKRRLRRSRKL